MSSTDDLPKLKSTHDTAIAAETAFQTAIDTCKLFLVQRKDQHDYGTDIQIEARSNDSMTNMRAHVQLKGTESAANTNGSISVAVDRTNLNYLITQPDSMYVCYHLPSKRLLVRYADDVYREYDHRGRDWTHQINVTVNFTQAFDEQFQRTLNARLLASCKSSRDRRLQWTCTPPEKIPVLVQTAVTNIEVPADPVQAREILAELYNAGNDSVISKSFAQFDAVLRSQPGAMDSAYMAEINLGINGSSFNKDRVKQSISILKEAMARGNAYPGTVLYCIGNAWLALGEHKKAQDAYRSALLQLNTPKLSVVAAQCCKNLGSALEGLREMNEARSFYERALVLDPDLGEAQLALAHWYRRNENDYSLALEHLDRAVRHKGSALQVSAVQGWRLALLFKTGDAKGAFREINNLLGQATLHNWIWPWCARHVAQFGKTSPKVTQQALLFWRAYLREHPRDNAAERERLLCLWYLRENNVAAGVGFDEFKLAVISLIENGSPDPAFLWDRVGHWAQYDGDWTNAVCFFRKAYDLGPAQYGYCLGTALNHIRQYREALPMLLSQAEEHQPDAMSWFQVAISREGVGDINGSISAYKRALELNPDYDLAWFNLGGLYWNSGDKERAAETWLVAVSRFPSHELAIKLRRDIPFIFEPKHNKHDGR